MAKGFGIAALVLAILAIFIPIAGLFVSAIAIACAIIAALAGDRIFATATAIIAGVNTFFLSASVWIMMAQQSSAERSSFTILVLVFVAAPFVAMLLNSAGKFSIGGKV